MPRIIAPTLILSLVVGSALPLPFARAEAVPLTLSAQSLATAPAGPTTAPSIVNMCNPEVIRTLASKLSTPVTIQKLPRDEMPGPFLVDGVRYTEAKGRLPAYCQVTGTFVTNKATGATANFLATLPATWNEKYLQLGCGGYCGTFAVSDAAAPTITITNQGKPGDSIAKGYASFATDQGHSGFYQGKWAVKEPGKVDQEKIDDLFYRSQKVLAGLGKQFTTEFYAQATGARRSIRYSYFCGCSGGGRDALVAASYFPEEFDGFVSGSPASNFATMAFQAVGTSLAVGRGPEAMISRPLLQLANSVVNQQCDALDGVADGLIQNPMACNFRPERDLPRCADDKPGDRCFTRAQAESLSALVTAVTDERGRVVHPGYSVSEMQNALLVPPMPGAEPWPDTGNPATGGGGIGLLGDIALRLFTYKNDPSYQSRNAVSFASGGKGPINAFRIQARSAEVAKAQSELRMGIGFPENAARMIRLNRKLLIWTNLSDQLLSPYMSINYYKRLAAMHGGYDKLQKNVRLFGLPGTGHCSGASQTDGPGSFDALSAIEDWVERGKAPDSLSATMYEPNMFGSVDFSKPGSRTMPLCKFPEMARYKGTGDVKDAANWSCRSGDRGMLKMGESGMQAGVVR